MSDHDVIIAGAGPAGAAAAKVLEERGISYLLLDKSEFPRKKACAGVLSPKIASLLDIPDSAVERPLTGYRVFSDSVGPVESRFPEPGFIVRREVFDDFLVKRLEHPPEKALVAGLEIREDLVNVACGNAEYRAKFVIGADGANSVVRKALGVPGGSIAIAAQYDIKIPEDKVFELVGDWFEVYYILNYGYGWISPMKEGLKIGIGIVKEHLDKGIWDTLDEFLEHPLVKKKWAGGEVREKEGHVIPMAGPLEVLGADRVLLAGDAGGFVYPGTGEGIYYAVRTGQIAARVVCEYLEEDSTATGGLQQSYLESLEKEGMLGLREAGFVEDVLSSDEKIEAYMKKLRYLSKFSR